MNEKITNTQKETMVNFLEENIKAVELLLTPLNSQETKGFPSAILLFSIIDSIGTIELEESRSFEILKEDIFGSQEVNVKDLQDGFRNPFIHNNILFPGRYIYTANDPIVFKIKNNKIEGINLLSLLKICKEAVNKFKNIPKNKISDHPYIKMKTEQHSLRGTTVDSFRNGNSSILAQANDSNDNIQITGSANTSYRRFRP